MKDVNVTINMNFLGVKKTFPLIISETNARTN